jgi:hypothetical protein
MLFGWLAAFYNAPEGVAAPLAGSLGAGKAGTGVILAAGALGAAVGGIVFTRLAAPGTRLRWVRPLAWSSCAVLGLLPLAHSFGLLLAVLFASGVFDCYQVAASSAFVSAAPAEHRSQVFGLAQAGMSLGQGAVMILAGAAAQSHSPASVIAVIALVGAITALAIPGGRTGPIGTLIPNLGRPPGTSSGHAR